MQPNEGVSLAIGAKVPGQGMTIRTVHMDFLYGGAFREGLPDAYERLILDAMLGDATLFTRSDEIEEQWALVDAIVGVLAARPAGVPELRGRDVGAGPRRTSSCTATAGRGAGTDASDDAGRARTSRSPRSSASWRGSATRRRAEGAQPNLRTSVMTHIAWVPPQWQSAAEQTLAGMAERHPSRTLLLVPRPDERERDRRAASRSGASRSAIARSAAR